MSRPDDRDPHEHEELGRRIRAAADDVRAPGSLHASIAAARLASRAPRRPARRAWTFAAAGAAAAVLVLVAVLALAPSAGQAPTVDAAATLALRTPAGPAPAEAPDDHRYVDLRVGSIRFPSNAYTSAAPATGVREQQIGGRRAVAVSYGEGAGRVGYTVVDGDALAIPASARRTTAGGVAVATYERDGAHIVTWRRDGHTCVVASRTVPLPQLLRYVGRET